MAERRYLPLLFDQRNYCDGATDWCMDVRFTAKCDSACSFCIAADDMKYDRGFDHDAMLKSVKQTPQIRGLSIIGGEPLLLMDKLLIFMDAVREEAPHIEKLYVTTALPYTVARFPDRFQQVLTRTAILNVSVQHYDPAKNNLILRTRSKYDRVRMLEKILESEEARDKIRVHLNLVKGGIDSAEELNRALHRLREMGVRDVKINELMNAPDEYVSFEDITGVEMQSAYAHGCSTEIDYFPGIVTTVKRSCFVVEPSRGASKQDLLKVMWKEEMGFRQKDPTVPRVLYEDGSLTSTWAGEPLV